MATRTRTRRTAPPSRRRPGPRRRPAPRRGGSRIRWDRVGRIALTLVLGAVLYSYLNPAIDLVETYRGVGEAKAERHRVLDESQRLHERVQSADDPAVISRKARAQGLVAEGETPLVVRGLGGAGS